MKNKFIIIIPAYNVGSWITLSLELIKLQSYDNFECVIIDDNSTDDTNEKIQSSIKNDDRFHLLTNTENIGSSLANFIKGFDYMSPDDEDIIVRIDGDDWLSSVFVLDYLNEVYVNKKCWLTYGTYQSYTDANVGDHHCIDVPDEVHDNNSYRQWHHVYSHLRTHKAFLLKNVNRVDLKYPNSNSYFKEAEDVAHMFPLVEMSGKDKICRIPDILLILNRINPMNVASIRRNKQKATENIIRSMNKYNVIEESNFVTANFAGGLGNLLFQIANAYSFGLEHNLKCKFGLNHSLPRQGTKIHNYYDNIFKKIQFNSFDKSNFKIIEQKRFEYDDYLYRGGNICFNGHFQSYKFFEVYESEIRNLFEYSDEIKEYILKKYGKFLDKRTVSIHIRRGDYLQLPKDYIKLDKTYYDKALSVVSNKIDVILVFSDDIKWCKENFSGGNFIFIENEKDYIDLYLMSMCNHNIISNSSFSWWGAWLNQDKEKVVIAPEKWFGPNKGDRNLDDLLMNDWILI